MRIITDIFAFCTEKVPRWNTISISGYHIREAGSTAVQEVAFTLADAIAYVDRGVRSDWTSTTSPAALLLLQRAQQLPRGDREIPRGAAFCGTHHERGFKAKNARLDEFALPQSAPAPR